ncbi:eukaryotic ribosome biogenesis protein 1 [Candida tropicalis MYA-3404]|uniref:Ribosome biogenesis protein ERB1 n=1 Tax=Candida tropicalis (strain ATCC MYA-3404 / T1) TaxID=294747 RepID=C5MFA5_CANTT|nr:eukaryotic ribosome biogenesis protein 1 [Candida tropicalis MYA-3404]EER31965.1 eukaryotic ribosome biogenesis protein 1 [Candida tropicalis MYA-3404]KAG4405553.1 hypothetical protein JTP64_005589 [Candida tropicalis]
MAKNGIKKSPVVESKKKDVTTSKKRKPVEEEVEESESDDEINVQGLIDADDDDDEEEEVEEEEDDEKADEEEDDEEEASLADSEEELNQLLGEEEDPSDYESEDFSDEPKDDISGINIKSLSVSDADTTVTKFSDGTTRILKPEIDPKYDSDDSDKENFNTIGNIPFSAYDEMPHIGYDINGKRIMRPARGSALDSLLESIDLPEGWTGLLDQNTGTSLKLTSEELELIRKIRANENVDSNIDPYEPLIDWFTKDEEIMPVTAVPEPKRRFVPSKHEAKRVMKIVKAIREGRIIPPDQVKEKLDEDQYNFDLWQDEVEVPDHIMTLRAPKLPPPTNEESYNPPEEYLLTEEEKAKWLEEAPVDRERNFLPQKYKSLRQVPGYQESVRERFERSLDLYLAPRVRHNKLNIDPDSLIPDLPSPKDLRPFPIRCSTIYEGHTGKIRTVSIDPQGLWLATGSDDGSVRIWEVLTGRQVYKAQIINTEINNEDHIESLEWNPDSTTGILAVCAGENIYLIVPPIFGFDIENTGKLRIESGWGYDTFGNKKKDLKMPGEDEQDLDDDDDEEKESKTIEPKKEVAKWFPPNSEQTTMGVSAVIQCRKTVKKISWHRKGDYFVTVSPDSHNTAVLIHQISKHISQSPFRKSKGIIMDAKFHPFKPQLFVSSQRQIKIYDLAQQVLLKKLMPGVRLLSTIDIHPRGDNLIAGSYDKRVTYFDLELSQTPFKKLRYHDMAIRSVVYHKGQLPLFATGSDDGTIHIFHNSVYDDANPLIVPLKKLTMGNWVLDLVWHPKQPWIFAAGADGKAYLYTN